MSGPGSYLANRLPTAALLLATAVLVATVVVLLPACGEGSDPTSAAPGSAGTSAAADSEWDTMVRSEELIHQLMPHVKQLSRAVENLALPDASTRGLFAPAVSVRDLADDGFATQVAELPSIATTVREARFAHSASDVAQDELRLWRSLLDEVSWFDHAGFKIVRGHFVPEADGTGELFETDVVFHGLATLSAGGLAAYEVQLALRWRKLGAGPDSEADWQIAAFIGQHGQRLDRATPLYGEVLDQAVPDPDARARARDSIHERLVADVLLERRMRPHPYFSLPAQDRHPGLAVADVNSDGFDDLYVMARWGKNLLFVNRGDGTFEELAGPLGLDVEDHCSSALFADFDNDDDVDLLLGRTLERSLYFENTGEGFVDRSDSVGAPLPYLASSLSAVDVDRDGLLDVYVSTYGSYTLARALRLHDKARRRGEIGEGGRYVEFLSNKHLARFTELQAAAKTNPLLDAPGPPNVLLKNQGNGRFRRVMREPLAALRNTYQATWADVDGDGDADVYLANDFAPDSLLRNDDGAFVDISSQIVGADIGFGMGATWGDYDRDGRQDLYVSNMFSKAGTRITASLNDLDARYAEAAQGNYLFRNGPDGLQRASGHGEGGMLAVEHAGWGWGSLFADVDNDGFLDLLALSGYYTAPSSVATAVDT